MPKVVIADADDWKGLAELRRILEEQDCRCAYTGKKLVIGDNASLDHKIPVSRGGAKEPGNIHWVDWTVNTSFKNGLSHNNFLDLCEATWRRREDGQKLDDFDKTLVEIWEYQLGKPDNRDYQACMVGKPRKVGASRTEWWITTTESNLRESATENIPPKRPERFAGKGEKVR